MKLIFPVIDAAGTGANILALRRQRGLSVREVQEWFGFDSPRAIYKWQKGETLPSVDNLYALSVLLGVSMEQILVPMKRQMSTTEEKTQLQERIAAAFFCWRYRFCEILSVNPGLYDKIMIGVAERQILLFGLLVTVLPENRQICQGHPAKTGVHYTLGKSGFLWYQQVTVLHT